MKSNRRAFLTAAASTAALAPAVAQQSGASQNAAPPAPGVFRRPLAPDTPPFEGPLEFTRGATALMAEPFPMRNVRLLAGSVYHDAQEWHRGYIARLPMDRLLYTFRVNAGLPTGSAKPLGGWE